MEQIHREDEDGQFWIEVLVDRLPYTMIGPFDTREERQLAHDDPLEMMKSMGAKLISPYAN